MSDFLFTDFKKDNPITPIIENNKIILYNDIRFAHPELSGNWDMSAWSSTAAGYNPELPNDTKAGIAMAAEKAVNQMYDKSSSTCDITEYEVPGCPEEPDASVKVLVYRPKDLNSKKARVLFYCMGGGLLIAIPAMFSIELLCQELGCVAIVPKYRLSWQAPYPAAINDLHAAYAWMVQNAGELGVNPKRVVITGNSTGGHLGLSLAFRLKRFKLKPRGVVALAPQTDERESGTKSDYLYDFVWGAQSQHDALLCWLGKNFGSSRIGPEALANHARVEDCIGLPPIFIHTAELDPDRDHCREFYGKLLEAQVYAEFHSWGGCHHASEQWAGVTLPGELNKYSERVRTVVYGNIRDCFEYDLSRDWLWEEQGLL